jgi:hypothetical protein
MAEAAVEPHLVILWRFVHEMVLGTTLAMTPLNLSDYVILWIVNLLPHVDRVADSLKIRLISNVTASIRRVTASRGEHHAFRRLKRKNGEPLRE